MNPLSSHPQNAIKLILLALAVFLLGPACLGSAAFSETTSAQAARVETTPTQGSAPAEGQESIRNTPAPLPTRVDAFLAYGFTASGFTAQQEETIRKTLAAYAGVFGGRKQLRGIITGYNGGEAWQIYFDPGMVGADSGITLSPTVFSLEKSLAAGFNSFATGDDERHAQIIIGHEIGHILIWAAETRTGIDWTKAYEEQVKRDWPGMHDSKMPIEEAVTELSLNVLNTGYYLNLCGDSPETDPEILAQIDGWVEAFLQSFR